MKAIIPSVLVLAAVLAEAAEYKLPAANQGNWRAGIDVGVVGGIDQYRDGGANQRGAAGGHKTIDVTQAPYHADNTGVAACQTAIKQAIDDASPGDVVYLPAGTYRVTGYIYIDDNDDGVTVRGAGPDQTFIYGSFANAELFKFVGGGGTSGSGVQAVTGTKTKGTSNLQVASSAGYSAGRIATVFVENEENNARITAGAAPTWSNSGFRDLRRILVRVTAVPDGTHITVDPPLPWDCTDYATRIERHSLDVRIEKFGFEDFSFTYNAAAHPTYSITMDHGIECWVYNVHAPEWLKNSSNGSMVFVNASYRCEVRRCRGIANQATTGDDGFIQVSSVSSSLFEDNIVDGWDVGIYNSGKTINNVYSYNYVDCVKPFLVSHNAHPSLELFEGNVVSGFIQADGYHGSTSHNTFFRNWTDTTWALNRFTRYFVLVGNVSGHDGVTDAAYSMGNPNIGNSAFTGTAEPSAGDFWADWGMTGTLTTRTSDTAGVVTVSGGNFAATSGGSPRNPSLYWNGFASSRTQMTMTARAGLVLTVSGGSGSILPAEGTSFDGVWVFTQGYQERDLDVANTTTLLHNYDSRATGTGSVTNPTEDTLPLSLARTSKPAWWNNRGFEGAWPPVNPDVPKFSIDIIPAGYRFLHTGDPKINEGDGAALPPRAPGGFRAVILTGE